MFDDYSTMRDVYMGCEIMELENLKHKLETMLEVYREDLTHVLRYRGHGYIVPTEIEGITKYIKLNKRTLQVGDTCIFNHQGKDLCYRIIKHEKNGLYTIQEIIDNESQPEISFYLYNRGGLTYVEHDKKLYRELPDSGNVYNHISTQNHDIQRATDQDIKEKYISEKEKHILEITNLFHDIPEVNSMEIVNNGIVGQAKTSEESSQEQQKAYTIINEYPAFSEKEKQLLWEIYEANDQKGTLFKFFEHFRYLLHDSKLFHANQEYSNNYKRVFGEFFISTMPYLLKEYTTPEGKIIQILDLPSVREGLKNNIDYIDFGFSYTGKHCMDAVHESRRNEYDSSLETWNNIKKFL